MIYEKVCGHDPCLTVFETVYPHRRFCSSKCAKEQGKIETFERNRFKRATEGPEVQFYNKFLKMPVFKLEAVS